VALGAGALALCCALPAVVAIIALPGLLKDKPSSLFAASPSATPARSPLPNDPVSVRQAWVRERIVEALNKQGAALLAGDEAAYLSGVGAKATAAHNGLLVQYRSLRAMEVKGWRYEVVVDPLETSSTGQYRAEVSSFACFVTTPCADAAAQAKTLWQIEGGGATLIEWTPATKNSSPHPWQVSELLAKSGERTVVATTKAYAGKLPSLLIEAEKAALVADRFARGDKVPSRYVVYYAGPKEWKQWFSWDPPTWSAGVAIDVSDDRYELVLNGATLHPAFIDDLLRHELTHSASLPGRYRNSDDLWWLIEGIAEVAEMEGTPVSKYPSLDDVGRLVKSWPRNVDIQAPEADTAEWLVGAKYGVAFLALRHLAERYGEQKMVEFFHTVVHDGKTVAQASLIVFGEEWSKLRSECADYVERTAR
jgi:hypothetical protein